MDVVFVIGCCEEKTTGWCTQHQSLLSLGNAIVEYLPLTATLRFYNAYSIGLPSDNELRECETLIVVCPDEIWSQPEDEVGMILSRYVDNGGIVLVFPGKTQHITPFGLGSRFGSDYLPLSPTSGGDVALSFPLIPSDLSHTVWADIQPLESWASKVCNCLPQGLIVATDGKKVPIISVRLAPRGTVVVFNVVPDDWDSMPSSWAKLICNIIKGPRCLWELESCEVSTNASSATNSPLLQPNRAGSNVPVKFSSLSATGFEYLREYSTVQEDDTKTEVDEESLSSVDGSFRKSSISRLPREDEVVRENTDIYSLIDHSRYSKELEIGFFKLTQLPAIIFEIQNLTSLSAMSNDLVDLPEELGNLVNLKKLELSKNNLTHLPESLGQLSALTRLDLAHNKLSSLPHSTSKLTDLVELVLDYNAFDQFPAPVLNLVNLRHLYLLSNHITHLPDKLVFKSLTLSLDNRPSLVQQIKNGHYGITVEWNNIFPDQILPHLFLGSIRTVQSESLYDDLNITHIVTCGRGLSTNVGSTRRHLELDLDDNVAEHITRCFEEAHQFMNDAIQSNTNVLVHCFAGVSRSATIVVSYIMKHLNLSSKDAIHYVASRRPVINPNEGFRKQLHDYGIRLGLDQS